VDVGDAEEADDLVTTHERGTGVGLLQLHALGRGEPTDPVTMALDDGLSTAHRCQVARTTRAIDGDDAELLTLARGLWAELRHRSVLDRGGQVNQHGLALGRIIGGEVVALGDRGPMTGSVNDLGALPAPSGVGPGQRPFGATRTALQRCSPSGALSATMPGLVVDSPPVAAWATPPPRGSEKAPTTGRNLRMDRHPF